MEGFDPEGAASTVAEALRAAGTAERAVQEKRYLKSELEFFGVTVPELRRVVTGAVRGYPGLDGAGMVAWAVALWGEPVHERRMAAVEILTLAAPRLGAGELAVVERLVRESGTWALVDGLAANVAGEIALGDPRSWPVIDGWAVDAATPGMPDQRPLTVTSTRKRASTPGRLRLLALGHIRSMALIAQSCPARTIRRCAWYGP